MILLKYVWVYRVRAQACSAIMVNAKLPQAATDIRARPIAPSDHAGVAELLNQGFGLRRGGAFWRHVLDRLQRRPVPADLPNYGYLLESGGRPVGVV
jgi:hypothetical protein